MASKPIRLDKWLWFARVVKSRTLAQKIVRSGKIRVNREKIVNPAKLLTIEDVLTITLERRILFLKVIEYGNDYAPGGREARLVDVMLDELDELEPAPPYLPLSDDKRLIRIMETLLENPANEKSFEEIAVNSGASTRTLSRLFSKSTGMSFGEWRKQLRLLVALDQLGQGHPVTRVAFDLGYKSTNAFTAMFKRTLGAPPGAYLKG